MEKEIYEQPSIIKKHILGDAYPNQSFTFEEIHLIGCGSSYHAALAMSFLLEDLLKVPVRCFVASEFRCFAPHVPQNTLLFVLSQSGETADVLQAVTEHRHRYKHIIGICNAPGSSLTRCVDDVFFLHAGREIGVASTKAFTSSIMVLLKWALSLKQLSLKEMHEHIDLSMQKIHDFLEKARFQRLARLFATKKAFLILGRGPLYAVALEGALKIKELAYLHVQGLPIAELKHGTLALIDDKCPVIVLIPNDHLIHKNQIACEEILARGGQVLIIHDETIDLGLLKDRCLHLAIPSHLLMMSPVLFSLSLQMLALCIAEYLGRNVDKPRNLAKSVTVY